MKNRCFGCYSSAFGPFGFGGVGVYSPYTDCFLCSPSLLNYAYAPYSIPTTLVGGCCPVGNFYGYSAFGRRKRAFEILKRIKRRSNNL